MGGIDTAVLSLLALAIARGLWIGGIREAFSLGALIAAVIAVRLFTGSAAWWLEGNAPVELSPLAAKLVAGALIALLTITVVGLTGRIVRRGVEAVGLGMLDRLAGGLLGAGEGALIALLGLFLATALLGSDHPALTRSRTFQALDRLDLLPSRSSPAPTEGDVATYAQDRGRPSGLAPRFRASTDVPYVSGSVQAPWSRIRATRRSGAVASGTLRTTHSWPTYRLTTPVPEPT